MDSREDILCRICRVVEFQFQHYGAYACNRCRAFFRRMVRRQRKGTPPLPCITTKTVPSPSNPPICDISLFRGACQACRFQACLRQGMNPSLVLTDEVRNSRYSKASGECLDHGNHECSSRRRSSNPTPNNMKKGFPLFNTIFDKPIYTSFYFDAPIIEPPWLKDFQGNSEVESYRQPETICGGGSVANNGVALVVVDDSTDPIIGSVAEDVKDVPSEKEPVMYFGNWDPQRVVPPSNISNLHAPFSTGPGDQFNLDVLYQLMDEEHSKPLEKERRTTAIQSGEKGSFMASAFEMMLNAGGEVPSDFNYSVPEMESSSLLVNILEN